MQDMFVSCLLPVLSFRVFFCQENEAKWNVTCETGWKINKCGKYFNFWVPWSFCLSKVMSYEFSRLYEAARFDNIVRTTINWSQEQVPARNPNKQTEKIMLAEIEIVVCLLWMLEMWRCGWINVTFEVTIFRNQECITESNLNKQHFERIILESIALLCQF